MKTLPEYITEHLEKKFEWGVNDCCLFTGRWIHIASGKDLLSGRGKWKTALQAQRLIKKAGGIEKVLGGNFKEILPTMATDGDVTVRNGNALIFSGSHIVTTGVNGLVFIDRMEATRAWKVV